MAKRYKYAGILGKPRRISPVAFAADLDPGNEELQAMAEQHEEAHFFLLVQTLLESCGQSPMIDPALVRWDKVALILARRHIPAFGPIEIAATDGKKRPGAPRKTSLDDEIAFYCEVRSRLEKNDNERKAIEGAKKTLRLRESTNALDSRYRRFHAVIEKGKRSWGYVNSLTGGRAHQLLWARLQHDTS
jgi:hypothetical protein